MRTTHEHAVRVLVDAFDPPRWSERRTALYVAALDDLPGDVLHLAVLDLIRTTRYMPRVAEVRRAVLDLVRPRRPDAGEAWAEVLDAIRSLGRHGRPEWSHPLIGDAVRAVGGWRWLCDSTNPTADRARFLDAYARLAERDEHDVLGAPALDGVLTELSARLALPEGDDSPRRPDR
jgi:hypothetical protein